MTPVRIDWNAIPWETVRQGVERKTFSGDGATVALNRLMPGHEPRPHRHPHEQIAYVMSGVLEFHIGESVVIVEGGGLVVIPPDVLHWGVVLGAEPVLNLDVFTPKRLDYVR